MRRFGLALVTALALAPSTAAAGPPQLGWRTDCSRHSVPLAEIQAGGPGRDGIPALLARRFVRPADASWLKGREPVIELVVNGQARAYPLQIMVWHEIVNDTVGG